MRTWRTRRLGLDEADRLVAGDQPGPGHEGLGQLLAAARAPASPRELAGERAAVAGFVAARQRAVPIDVPKGTRRVRVPVSVRAVAMKVAAGFAVLAATGTAAAATTGTLPDGAQQRAHRLFSALGVPAPTPVPRRTTVGPGGGAPSPQGTATRPPASPTPSRTPAVTGGTAAPSRADALGLCTAWGAAQHPHGKAMSAQARAALAAAAGGEEAIARYCALVRGRPAKPAAPRDPKPAQEKGKPTATPSHPGNGNGDGTGNGNGHGNGPGKPHTQPGLAPRK
ncbi:hypothetical protein [Krasilnikovia cinnamomea]|nr:hypothetical protein [Krasilnikovia cinnamomea]